MDNLIYLDNNATTAPLDSVNDIVRFAMETLWGNPSSIHRVGQEARHKVDLARESVAKLINCLPSEITFTSGGTEAANLAIQSACNANPKRKVVITSQIEHAAVGEMMDNLCDKQYEVIRLDNCENGVVCIKQLKEILEIYYQIGKK